MYKRMRDGVDCTIFGVISAIIVVRPRLVKGKGKATCVELDSWFKSSIFGNGVWTTQVTSMVQVMWPSLSWHVLLAEWDTANFSYIVIRCQSCHVPCSFNVPAIWGERFLAGLMLCNSSKTPRVPNVLPRVNRMTNACHTSEFSKTWHSSTVSSCWCGNFWRSRWIHCLRQCQRYWSWQNTQRNLYYRCK